jgi:hypothetical protein
MAKPRVLVASSPSGAVASHLGCVEWICQVNGVGLFFHANDHRFAVSTQATHKMYGRVIFELLEICDSSMFTSI